MSPSRSACWKRFLPVGLIRSPTTVMPSTTTRWTGVHSTEGRGRASRPTAHPSNTRCSARIKSGVVPQQPPAANSPSSR